MINAIKQYNSNKSHIEAYGKLFVLLEQNIPVLSPQREELLRAQIVMAVSAVDTFFHNVVKIGLLQIFNGSRPIGKAASYPIELLDVISINRENDSYRKQLLLENAIMKISSKDSYQSAKSIEYAAGLLGVRGIWTQLSTLMGLSAEDIKNKISLIVRRRNQIAHESDINPATMSRFPITKADVDDVVDFLDKFVNAVYTLL